MNSVYVQKRLLRTKTSQKKHIMIFKDNKMNQNCLRSKDIKGRHWAKTLSKLGAMWAQNIISNTPPLESIKKYSKITSTSFCTYIFFWILCDRHVFVLRLREYAHWKQIAETEIAFEVKDLLYYKMVSKKVITLIRYRLWWHLSFNRI